jgi:hypothetical protein
VHTAVDTEAARRITARILGQRRTGGGVLAVRPCR